MPDEQTPKPGAAKAIQLAERRRLKLKEERAARKAVEEELAQLKGQPTDAKLKAEVEKLRGEAKSRAYRDAFDKAARKAGIAADRLDDAWELAKVDQSGEAPDEAAIGTAVGEFVGKRPYLKGEAPAGGAETPPPLSAGQGGGRGGSAAAEVAGRFSYTSANLSDAGWMRANQDKLSAALDNGTAVVVG